MSDAIVIDGVSKRFRIYHQPTDSLKGAALRFWRRGSYEDFTALENVSFRVPQGQTFGVLGANGSGKSTLLKILARILRPDSGTVEMHGRLAALLELGTGFHPELSGRENIYMNASIIGLKKREVDARFDDIVGFAELERFIDQPIKTYSSGMTVRLGFAVATSIDPEVLIIDEVLAVGDMNFRTKSRDRMDRLLQSGCTIVLVSHDMATMRSICQSAVSLEDGRVRMLGETESVIADYQEMMGEKAEPDPAAPGEEEKAVAGAIAQVDVLDAAGEPIDAVHSGDPVVLRVLVDAGMCPENVILTLGLQSSDGVALNHSHLRDVLSDLPESGHVSVSVVVDSTPLCNGAFDWTIALRHGETGELIDRQNLAAKFGVEGAVATQRGYVLLPTTVSRDDTPAAAPAAVVSSTG